MCKRDKTRGEGGPSYAGDIPLQNQRPMSSAPAYEPPKDAAANAFPSFNAPMATRGNNGHHRASSWYGDDWHDQKLGFAGQRSPIGRIEGAGHARQSSYGDVVGDEKR